MLTAGRRNIGVGKAEHLDTGQDFQRNGAAYFTLLHGVRQGARLVPEVSWTDMKQNCTRPHLIVGVVPAADLAGTTAGLKLRVELLARLARHLQLNGTYAIADFPDGIGREVHCILEDPADAVSLANAVEANESADHPEYASHRNFRCDNLAAAAIEARLREETTVAR